MKKLNFKLESKSIMTAFTELQSIFGTEITNKFYSVNLREHGISLQGTATASLIKELKEWGFHLEMGEQYLGASIGYVDVTLTFES